MDYEVIVRQAIAHVEARLHEPISVEEVAAAVHVSPYHFHRLFSAVMGEPLMAYVRRRRLEFAASALSEPERRIKDIVFECQFSSQATFTRAFQQAYGITPGRYRREGAPAGVEHAFTPGKEAIALARIVEATGFTFVGLALRGLEADAPNGPRLEALWNEFFPRTGELLRVQKQRAYGVCIPGQGTAFDYMAALAVNPSAPVPKGMVRVEVPPQRYVAFEHVGPPSNIPETYAHIFSTGLAAAGVFYCEGAPDMEVYREDITQQGESVYGIEIWIPIR